MDAFPSFKEFLASPAVMRLGLLSIMPDVGHTKSFPVCYILRVDCSRKRQRKGLDYAATSHWKYREEIW
jgi:hypothetical protein